VLYVYLAGIRQMAWFQNLTVVLKFLPLLFAGVEGWSPPLAEPMGPNSQHFGRVAKHR
jgi:hypothetical protein